MPDANGGRGIRRRLLRGLIPAAVLAVGGLTASPGVGPATAVDGIRGTQVDVPVPLPAPIGGDTGTVAESPGGGGVPAPTTVPPVTTPGTTTPPAAGGGAPSSTAPPTTRSGEDRTRATDRTRLRPRPAAVPGGDGGAPAEFVPAGAGDDRGATVERLRDATVPAARQFSLPLSLGALVLTFLAVQGRMDKRDAKLMVAPLTVADDLLPFA